MPKRQDLPELEALLVRIADRLDRIEANQTVTNHTLRDLGQVQGIMSDQLVSAAPSPFFTS